MAATFADLLAAVAGAPALPGARCRGRGHLFDDIAPGEEITTTEARHRQALTLCAGCPSLTRCRDWLAALAPRERPRGVVAGAVVDRRGSIRTAGRGSPSRRAIQTSTPALSTSTFCDRMSHVTDETS